MRMEKNLYGKHLFIVGIDEAGRGPLAGPVAVGAVLVKKRNFQKVKELFAKIKGKDSKKAVEVYYLWKCYRI